MSLNSWMNSCNTWNLRNDAEFKTLISRDIYWIPINYFGRTRYTNYQMQEILKSSLNVQREHISNLYEAIQLFQNLKFEIIPYKPLFTTPDGLNWQYQLSPFEVCMQRKGSCCEMASWLYYFICEFFDEAGYILVQRRNNGHIINYFRYGENYYFIDIETFHFRYKDLALIETGNKKDFYLSHYFTCGLFKSTSIQKYISYYNKVANLHKTNFAFYRIPGGFIPPIATKVKKNITEVYISKSYDFELLNDVSSIKTIYVNYNPVCFLNN